MNRPNLNHLTKLHDRNDLEIEISDPTQTDANLEADLQNLMGMKQISASHVRELRSVGVHLKRMGIVETQRGTMFVNQAWLLGASQELYRLLLLQTKKEVVDIEAVTLITKHLGELAEKQSKLSAVMMLQEPKDEGGSHVPMPTNNTFPAGAIVVGGNGQAHIYQSQPATEIKKTVADTPAPS